MDDEEKPLKFQRMKRPRTETDGEERHAAEERPTPEAAILEQPQQQQQPLSQQQQPQAQPGPSRRIEEEKQLDGHSVTDNILAHSGISPLPQQHQRLANTDLPGCIVRQDFHCAVLSDALGQQGVEQCLSFHPNGLAVVQLAPTHPAVGDGDRAIVAVDFDAGGCNVLDSALVKGKKKKGALQLLPATILCSVMTRGGKEYKVCTGISGELIQANKTLAGKPRLMSEDPLGRGWLAIIRLKPRDLRRLQDALGVVDER
eukprot:g5603.t1